MIVFSDGLAQIPAFYMDTSHLFNTQHAGLTPPSLAQQQGFQPGLSQVNILVLSFLMLMAFLSWALVLDSLKLKSALNYLE